MAGHRKIAGAAAVVAAVVVAAGCAGAGRADRDGGGWSGVTGSSGPSGAMAAGGLVVSGEGEVVVPADAAYVVLLTGFDSGGFEAPVTARDGERLRAALEELGFDRGEVELSSGSWYAGPSVRVQVDPAELPDAAEQVENVVEDVLGRVELAGLHLVVDDCSAAVDPARQAAVADAREAAERLANASGADLGPLQTITETADPYPYFEGGDACDPAAIGDGAGLVAYDAPREVELSFYVSARFAIDGATGPTAVSGEGHGEVVAEADIATVVVLPDVDIDPLAATGDLEERPELLAALAATGIEEDAVRFIPLPLSGLGTEAIAVDVAVELVQDVSPEIVDAVEELRGSTGDTGVLFSSSTCPQLLLEAQQEAVADAEERMAALAAAADIELGALTEVVEISGGGFVASEADLLAAGTITGDEPCDPDAIIAGLDPYGGAGPLKPLDAEPETSVSSVVVLGRAAG